MLLLMLMLIMLCSRFLNIGEEDGGESVVVPFSVFQMILQSREVAQTVLFTYCILININNIAFISKRHNFFDSATSRQNWKFDKILKLLALCHSTSKTASSPPPSPQPSPPTDTHISPSPKMTATTATTTTTTTTLLLLLLLQPCFSQTTLHYGDMVPEEKIFAASKEGNING